MHSSMRSSVFRIRGKPSAGRDGSATSINWWIWSDWLWTWIFRSTCVLCTGRQSNTLCARRCSLKCHLR